MKKLKLRKIKKKWVAGGVILCVLVIIVVSFMSKKFRVKGEQGNRQMEATVLTGTIQTSVSGTGTISYADAIEIVLPADLVIDEMLVGEGSLVTEGMLLATVDEASLASCLNEVEEAISETDSTISSKSSSSSSQSIKAGVGGRVKKIYADAGDSVTDVMKEEGALMLLSVDDLMAVRLSDAGNISVGDEVKVSGKESETDGTVEAVDSEGAVITFDDSVFGYEEEVTVTSEDGAALGTGAAYIHQMIQVVGSSGTISSLNVSVDSSVSASTKVYTLDSSTRSAEYMQAVKEREQLVSLLDTLISIQADGGIVAAADGMVETINVNSSGATTTTNQSSSNTGFTISEEERDEKILAGKDSDTEKELIENTDSIAIADGGKDTETSYGAVLTNLSTAKTTGFITMSDVQETGQLGTSESAKAAVEEPKNLAGGAGVITGTTTAMEYAAAENADSWIACTDGSTKAAAGIWYVRYKETDVANASAAVQVTVTDENTEQQNKETGEQDTSSPLLSTENKNTTEETNNKENAASGTDTNISDNAASNSSTKKSTGSSAGTGVVSTSQTSSSSGSTSTASVETVSAFVIANGDKMKVTMNVDELDIGSMQEGLSAEITLDAVEGQTFVGEITSVSGSASASNGVAQYPVEITFDKTADMLSGMNASVAVIVEQAENVLTVPLIAVTDMGDKAYVYTGYDESSGELTGQREVTLGLSDENNVEIKSGLSEGDIIYYQMMGSEDSSNNMGNGMNGFNMKGMGGMSGDIPDDARQQFKNSGGRGNGSMPGGAPQ